MNSASREDSSDVFYINRYSIVRFLFSNKTLEELKLRLHEKKPKDYLVYLEDANTWEAHKKEIENKIELLKKEDDSLSTIFENSVADESDLNLKNKIQRRVDIKKQLTEYIQEQQNLAIIDDFLKDDFSQEKLLTNEEPHAQVREAEEDEISPLLYSEATFESSSTAIELNDKIQEFIEQLNHMTGKESVVVEGHAAQSVSASATTLRAIPLVSDFILGLNALREAYEAYKNPQTAERRTKLATGIFAGLVSIGAGIVGSLLLAGTGLLAGAAAIFITPIVLSAAIVGVYSATLYRDQQLLKNATVELDTAENVLHHLETDFAHETENIITQHLNSLKDSDLPPDVIAVKNKEADIKNIVLELQRAEQNQDADSIVNSLKDKIHTAYQERNNQIAQSKTLKKDIIEKLQSNPRLARIGIQKNRLAKSIAQLNIAKESAEKKRTYSALCLAGVGFALAAVCITGVGAVILGAIATVALVVGSVARVYQVNKDKQKMAAHHEAIKQGLHDHTHSSLYDVDYRLLHGKKDAMVSTLVQQEADLIRAKQKIQPKGSRTNVIAPNPDVKQAETETKDTPPNMKHP